MEKDNSLMLYLLLTIAIRFKKVIACTLLSWLLSACDNKNDLLIQGYVEGDFMYIAAPASGVLKKLHVKKGDRIHSDALLFALDNERETQRYLQAQHQLDIEQSTLVDLQSGRRKTELDVLRAQLNGAIIATRLAHSKLARNEKQAKRGAISEFELETYRSDYNQKAAVVEELQNRLSADELPARDAQQRAQTARIEAAKSVLNQSKWALDQMTRASLVNAQVFDTFYQVGEWVPAGSPVVSLLPPGKHKIRFFISAALLPQVNVGKEIKVILQPGSVPVVATIDYLSAEAEYTPPVIYSNERREKLIFLIEAKATQSLAGDLHPGMPVTVDLSS
ncbi:HlyD family efflux transporter periplasmic adaptor subunit [Serratia fonticola]|uniref:HlyD family secretion protein n=1 Tax=Serratia fonticola TaxID=47917 RepID=UPI001AE7AC31|nr:HlyD family efflux transporter periplasmic adaptor subunit [Serratia fonticola]MBP1037985.1 HlyD family efflux transporter periplasmic adaptor subunit [Serratia fonticola]